MQRIIPLLIGLFLISNSIFAQNIRSFDGSQNNLQNPTWGATFTPLQRLTTISYADGYDAPGGTTRPNPRTISNALFAQDSLINDPLNLSDFVWVFGQFIDHDISLTGNGSELAMVPVPAGDPWFDPFGQGTALIFMSRSEPVPGTGTDINNPRQHANNITTWLDASNVYGSDLVRANWLRTFQGGKMRLSTNNLLPFNTFTSNYTDPIDPNAPHMDDDVQNSNYHFVAGDVRANENPLLSAFHTLFVREHNRLCDELIAANPSWSDEQTYQHARKIVGGLIQNTVYSEWLPSMGVHLPTYAGYDASINASVSNVFSAAAFRMGHTLLNSVIRRIDNNGNVIPAGNLLLQEAFFNPLSMIWSGGGIDPLFKGMATQTEQNLDCKVINDVRNFLFGPPGAGGLDLASININRGRERGLPDFNTVRSDFGLTPYASFLDLTGDALEAAAMQNVYGNINDLDPWVGMLAEKHMPGALFGETIMEIMEQQFFALREGDRFYFENDVLLSQAEKDEIRNTTLHDIIMRNTNISLMQANVFKAMDHGDICNPSVASVNVEGMIALQSGTMMEDVEVVLDNGSNALSQPNGLFSIDADNCETQTLTLGKEDNPKNGVTTFDLVLIQAHILGNELLDSPYKMIAADVNQSTTITTFDMVEIRRVILNQIPAFLTSPSWQFFPTNFVFTDPTNPFGTTLPENTFNVTVSNDAVNMDFFGVKIGDVNNSATPNLTSPSSETRTNDAWTLLAEDKTVRVGETVDIQLTSEALMNLKGMQFTLNYDLAALAFVDVESATMNNFADENFAVFENEGAVTFSWNGDFSVEEKDQVFHFSFEAKENGQVSNWININSRMTRAEAYSMGHEILDINLMFTDNNEIVNNAELKLYQNQPNPFNGFTTIGFDLPDAGAVELRVYDLSGKSITTIQRDFDKGYQEINLDGQLFSSQGIYYYQLKSDFGTATRKMFFVE